MTQRNSLSFLWSAALALSALMAGCAGNGPAAPDSTPTARAAAGPMRDITGAELARRMSPGWNLGNSLEATGSETAWGNAPTTQALMDAVKAAGFRSVRIPVAWAQYADAQDDISPAWMARVEEVVGYARKAGLIAVINIHWDGGWQQPTAARRDFADARLKKYWTQIATRFKDYDENLLFAGTNEVMVDNDWGRPKPEYVQVQNGFNQLFVDTVRATGGNNARRHLLVQAFNTNIQWALDHFVVPRDTVADRLMLEVHYYDPFNFTLNTDNRIWQWGARATDPAATETWANESHVDAEFLKMKQRFIDHGMPVVLGEYAANLRTEFDPAGTYRNDWNVAITKTARKHGLVPMYWDNGYPANHQSGLFDRATGAQAHPDAIKAIVEAAR
ncbi:glycoside hydrolase family 5 protein [Roseateles sp. BYS78W]|uniref:Glycoside hydrolase family 5 protein n=1 Tax=Pelomonas candidula TaxID=3299025 RepID=A0ABW7HFJ6_9BURK